MLRNMMVVGLLTGAIATAGVAATTTGATGTHSGWQTVRNSPLGRLISGNIGRLLVLRSELNITPEQRAKVRQILTEHGAEIAATVKEVRAKRVALRKAVLGGEADESAILTAAHELGETLGDAAVKAAKLRADVAPVLTASQRTKIADFLRERDDGA